VFKIVPIQLPTINLRPFVDIIGQNKVNEIDMKSLQPVAKFSAVVDESLSEDWGYRHLFVTFYLEIPLNLDIELRQWQYANNFRISFINKGFMAVGLLSGPLDLWLAFFQWSAVAELTPMFHALVAEFFKTFKEFPKFNYKAVR
jgi:hypothetical protein